MKTNKEMCKSYYEKNKEKIKSKRRKDYALDTVSFRIVIF